MNPYLIHSQSLAALQVEQADACPVVTWAGADRLVLPGTAILRKDLANGSGFQLNADFVFTALIASWGQTNAQTLKAAILQTTVTYLGDLYKAISVHIAPGGLQVHVECNSLNQRA